MTETETETETERQADSKPPPAVPQAPQGPQGPRRLTTRSRRARFALSPKRALGRFVISSVLGLSAFTFLTPRGVAWWVRAVVGWDVGALALVVLAWAVILGADAKETRRRAAENDPGRAAVFGIALVSSLFSLFAASFVLRHVRALDADAAPTWTLLTLAAIALSWVVTHTAYTLRYAHLYYQKGRKPVGGLQFPGEDAPADIDFAYFAFTIGMCFQVSDVIVTSTACRRAVLLHAVLSFVYNTAILALALNLAFGMMS